MQSGDWPSRGRSAGPKPEPGLEVPSLVPDSFGKQLREDRVTGSFKKVLL